MFSSRLHAGVGRGAFRATWNLELNGIRRETMQPGKTKQPQPLRRKRSATSGVLDNGWPYYLYHKQDGRVAYRRVRVPKPTEDDPDAKIFRWDVPFRDNGHTRW